MEKIAAEGLSTELQELYLQNKEWLSQVCFLEDEGRFYQKLFGDKLFYIGKKHTAREIDAISESLAIMHQKTTALKVLVTDHQHLLERILKTATLNVGINLIEEHSVITCQISEVFLSNRMLKSQLFEMVEGIA